MNERISRIEDFLQKLATIRKKNNNLLKKETVYYYLTRYDIPNEDNNIKIHHQNWIKDFAKTDNINVFVSPFWTYFCQFINLAPESSRWNHFEKLIGRPNTKNSKPESPNQDPIKLYISLDSKHIYEGAKIIFNFLAKENIYHVSKIGSDLRNDEIVIRVFERIDAEKIINFINSNKYLIKGHLNPNPFCFRDGIVGLAQDNYNSYNTVISVFIKEYINAQKDLKNINYQDFYNYIEKFDIKNEQFLTDATGKINRDRHQDIIYINEIKDLILRSLKTNNLESFYEHFNSTIGNRKGKNKELTQDIIINRIEEAIKITSSNYNIAAAKEGIKKFLTSGDTESISRRKKKSDDSRNMRAELSRIGYEKCREVLFNYSNKFNIDEAIDYLLFQKKNDYYQIIKDLDRAYMITKEKYNELQAANALKKLLTENNASYITRYDHNKEAVRDQISKYQITDIKEAIKEFCNEKGLNMINNNYINTFIAYLEVKNSHPNEQTKIRN